MPANNAEIIGSVDSQSYMKEQESFFTKEKAVPLPVPFNMPRREFENKLVPNSVIPATIENTVLGQSLPT